MKKIFILLCCCSAAAISTKGQIKAPHQPVFPEWEEKPVVHPVPPEYAGEHAIIVLQDVTRDIRFVPHGTNVYYTLHRIVKVLDDKGIEWYNKVAIPVGPSTRVPEIKARTISQSGKVQTISRDMIKVTRDEQGMNEIVFAMEGVEKNSEIELLVKEILPRSFSGCEYFQFDVPVVHARFQLSYPRDFVFEEKGYGGFPTVKEMADNNRKHITIVASDIPALHGEAYSYPDLYRERAEYRLHHVIDENDIDNRMVNSWDDLARNIFSNNYRLTEKERATVNNYISTLDVHANAGEAGNIRKIENGIKSQIVLYPDMDNDNAANLDSIIANKAADAHGYLRLFAACFAQSGIDFELGLAGDRRRHQMDAKFQNWNNMEHYVFYFPNLKKFLDPTDIYYRYPVVREQVLTEQGVFCTIPPRGDLTGGVSQIRTIDPLPAAFNQEQFAAGVTFSESMEPTINVSYSLTGYAAANGRKELVQLTPDHQKDFANRIITCADDPDQVSLLSLNNTRPENIVRNQPLEVNATVVNPSLVEKAGKNYLFKVGALMGPYESLYNEAERVLPVDLPYACSRSRTITIHIPRGYAIMNPDELRRKTDYVDKTLKPVISFSSDYRIVRDRKAGDMLVITVEESYNQLHFPAMEYSRYRDVVDAASDFGKVALVLARKG